MNHFAGKVVVRAQENLMKARDERVALMNEARMHLALALWYLYLDSLAGMCRFLVVSVC